MASKPKNKPARDVFEMLGNMLEVLQEFNLSGDELSILLKRDGEIHLTKAIECLVNSIGAGAWEIHDGIAILKEPLLTNGWLADQWIDWYEKSGLPQYDFSWPEVIELLQTDFYPMPEGMEIRPAIINEFALKECYPRTALKIRETARVYGLLEPPTELTFLLMKAIVERKLPLEHNLVVMHRSIYCGHPLKSSYLLEINRCYDTKLKRPVKYINRTPEKPGLTDEFRDVEFVFMAR